MAPRKAVEKPKIDANILDEPVKQKKQASGSKQSVNERIEEALSEKYIFRFNTIKCKPEFIGLDDEVNNFKPLDKYTLNSLWRELDVMGIKTSPGTLKEILESSYASRINPVEQYFNTLPVWDQTDYIQQLCDTVKVTSPEIWKPYLKKWLVGCVAQVFRPDICANHVCLVLCGSQGAFKTTWLDNLCPKSLNSYLFTGKIDPSSKDSLTYIAEFFLVNIDDQLKQLNRQDENQLKALITIPRVKYRRPYDPYITEYPHLCSFMASVNGRDFLTDPTGSRRFLPFEVLSIDIKAAQALNIDNIWRQAFALYKEKFQYYFASEELSELERNNELFQVTSDEEGLLLHYFKAPVTRGDATHFYPGAYIKSLLETWTKGKLSQKRLGEALNKHGFESWQKTIDNKKVHVWSVITKDGGQLEKQSLNDKREAEVF